MIKFPNSFLDEIRARILTSEVVRRKVALKNNGREHSGLCPFHKEKSPSFTVNDEKGFYHCFGCGAHGDIIKFTIETEGLSFPEVVEQLANQAGLAMPRMTAAEEYKEKQAASLHDIMTITKQWFIEKLYSPEGRHAREYLDRRALSKDAAELFGLGYAPESRHALRDFLKSKDISDTQMFECGLLAKNEKGEIYDKFRGRLMFPIFDVRGQTIAFGGRTLGDGQPKYLNSPETQLFKKGDVLYNENLARKASFKTGRLVVTEGYIDVIALYMAGIKEVVAPLGTAITERQLGRMWNLSKEPIMCLDGDSAGQRAMLRAASLATPLLKAGHTLKFATMPKGLDPDDVIKTGGVDKMAGMLRNASMLSEVLWQKEFENTGTNTPEARAMLEKNLETLAAGIKDKNVSAHYKNFFREKMRGMVFGKNNFVKSKKDLPQRLTNLQTIPDINIKSRAGAESLLMLIILHHPEILQDDEIFDEFINIDFSSIKLDKMRICALEVCPSFGEQDSNYLIQHLEKAGFRPDISYLEGLELYQKQEGASGNNVEITIRYWQYAIGLYSLANLKEECQNFSSKMTEDSEAKAFELMGQIAKLEENISRMERAFAENS